MALLITGVAGFIGCNLAEVLLDRGYTVFGVDNFYCGQRENLSKILNHPGFQFIETEMTDLDEYADAVEKFRKRESITEVWHLAANSDIPAGIIDSKIDLRDTFMTTFFTLEIMKAFDIKILAFASSSAIYGDLGDQPLTEDIGPLLPISNYGAMKLASEAIISAAVESHLQRAFIFRFPNVIGVPATHGVILDFIRKLSKTPGRLDVLGNGMQQKSYLHVDDLIDAMLFIRECANENVAVFNIGGGDAGVTVRFIAEETVHKVSPGSTISYGEGEKGWIGDVPKFIYCTDKIRHLGWSPKISSKEAVRKAIQQILAQEVARL